MCILRVGNCTILPYDSFEKLLGMIPSILREESGSFAQPGYHRLKRTNADKRTVRERNERVGKRETTCARGNGNRSLHLLGERCPHLRDRIHHSGEGVQAAL